MNHLNIFNSYKDKANHHEDELTRTFLVLLKNIPIVQQLFLDIVMDTIDLRDEALLLRESFYIEEVHTQLSNNNQLFKSTMIESRKVISVIISDDLFSKEHTVENSNRKARYDGVVMCNPGIVFLIENKPFVKNVWAEQLNPNLPKDKDIRIHHQPCPLSWRNIITDLNRLISKNVLSGAEKWIVEDFLQYIDNNYKWINPYTNFNVCKNDKSLLDKRCILAMSKILINGEFKEVTYHKNWKHYIQSDKSTIKQIALDSTVNNSNWTIDLWMYAGDTMNSARESYSKLNIEKLEDLKKLGFTLEKNFHISYRSSNLLGFTGTLQFDEYISYWKENYSSLKQIKREDFENAFMSFVELELIEKSDWISLESEILNKKYNNLNVCPGFLIKYSWTKQNAINLDSDTNFENELRDKIELVFRIFSESI